MTTTTHSKRCDLCDLRPAVRKRGHDGKSTHVCAICDAHLTLARAGVARGWRGLVDRMAAS